jgi:hypothetical protein
MFNRPDNLKDNRANIHIVRILCPTVRTDILMFKILLDALATKEVLMAFRTLDWLLIFCD